MKFISKNPEPPAFQRWKEQEAENLESLYARAESGRVTVEKVWEHLPNNLPDNKEEEVAFYSKKELATSLIVEQGYLCAYCMRRISAEPPTRQELALLREIRMRKEIGGATAEDLKTMNSIEEKIDTSSIRIDHVDPKSNNPRYLTFKYDNIVASCNGGEKIPPPRNTYCDCKKNNDAIGVTPLKPDCESRFYFTLIGEIKPSEANDTGAVNTIETLGLSWFNDTRKETILGYYYEDMDKEVPISAVDAALIVDNLSKPKKGKFEPFCVAIINVLSREILKLAAAKVIQ